MRIKGTVNHGGLFGSRKTDFRGVRVGLLLVTHYLLRSRWSATCQCGETIVVKADKISAKSVYSCGCIQRRRYFRRRPRLLYKRERHALASAINRCHNPDASDFYRYGGRGITVCDRWRYGEDGMTGEECFLTDMGRRPSKHHSLDRRDNDGPYDPSNCRWATLTEQNRNRRDNVFVVWQGQRMILKDGLAAINCHHCKYHNLRKALRDVGLDPTPQQVFDLLPRGPFRNNLNWVSRPVQDRLYQYALLGRLAG